MKEVNTFTIMCTIEKSGVFPECVKETFFVKIQSENIFEATKNISEAFSKIEKELNQELNTISHSSDFIYLQSHSHNEQNVGDLNKKFKNKYSTLLFENLSTSTLLENLTYLKELRR
ncbi:hypothetical protein B4102_2162 [Heyndrickxia sporothermodurans]|uniref:Uncharacterized protein n=1 Tax=Heyndrickxia sporothermodurans TaxID=46224 RepID=A0A150LGR4_9BACI|nr:hypothetical protein [Heyndrickxia sporothermodurans]KYD11434.1 hypothetical protein B4102_2162 [Heyndrickxia sporothermodurans]